MSVLAYIIRQLLGEVLIDGASNPDRARLTLAFGAAVFAIIVELILVMQNGWMPLRTWSDGAFAGLMFATVTAIVPVAFGSFAFFRSAADKLLALGCFIGGAVTLAMSFGLASL